MSQRLICRRQLALVAAAAATLGVGRVSAQAQPIRIALLTDKTGPLEAYARQTQIGFAMGLEHATGGTMTLGGRRLQVIERDTQGKPDVGKAQLAAAYADDKVDLAVGPTSSGVALAMLPVALEHRKLLLVEPAVADSITGEHWNRYIFRTGRSSSQDAIANAVALDRSNSVIATLAQDSAFGRDGVKAFREALKSSRLAHEEYLPPATTDFTAATQRLIERLRAEPGRKVVYVVWAGASNPFRIADELRRNGIELAAGGNILPAMAAYKNLKGMEGATYYYFNIPRNSLNMWLLINHYTRYKEPPDFFTCGGMCAALAVAEALKRTRSDANTERLITTMEGMSFDTPKGKMSFRKEDHQAMQSMFHFRIYTDPAFPWGVPDLVRELRAEEMRVPIRTLRPSTS